MLPPLVEPLLFLAYCYLVGKRWVKDHARVSSLYKPLMVLTASAAKQVSKQLPLENQSGKVLGGDMAWGFRWVQAEIESRLEQMVCGYENVKGDTNLSSFIPFTFVCFFLFSFCFVCSSLLAFILFLVCLGSSLVFLLFLFSSSFLATTWEFY